MSRIHEHDEIEDESRNRIDDLNADFYNRFQYPWPPSFVRRRLDPSVEATMLAQGVGEWHTDVLPPHPQIWVAGCGTNQAVLTAIRFPHADVLGTDVSEASISASDKLAAQLGVTNLDLRVESINEASYDRSFDHIISTGVIHHNADPGQVLASLARALRLNGALELMVYNRYHCIEAVAVQDAVRLMVAGHSDDFDDGLRVALGIVRERPHLLDRMATGFYGIDQYETAAADALLQPVMHSYTVANLEELARAAGLHLGLPCTNEFDVSRGQYDWALDFDDPGLQGRYDALPDVQRRQITNLVDLDRSPLLWFYLRHTAPRTEAEILDDFAQTTFACADTTCEVYVRDDHGDYHLAGAPRRYPDRPSDPTQRRIFEEFESRGSARLGDVLNDLDIPADFTALSRLRVRLATPTFPYLERVRQGAGERSR